MFDPRMAGQTVDLTQCDREPIHIPGSIQPHGVLLALQADTLEITQVSQNLSQFIEQQPQDVLGRSLADLLPEAQILSIQQCLMGDFSNVNPLDISLEGWGSTHRFDGVVQTGDGIVILELEPKTTADPTNFFQFYHQVRGAIAKIQAAPTLHEMCQVVVSEIRRITGFDRVMVYQFDETEAGWVVAESTDLETPYLHLRYPATDIPQQARQLYIRNGLRLIPTVHYQPVPLLPPNNPMTGQPLDLSLAALRSVSPVHREYLQNMGVAASMSISLVQNPHQNPYLWGLIACHHSSPKEVPYGVRTACEFIGQVMSLELANKATTEDLDYKMQLKAAQTRFVEVLSQSQSFMESELDENSQLLELVGATGAVVCSGGRRITLGETPPEPEIEALLDWLKPHLQHNLFQTQSLLKHYPRAAAFKAIASGLLALEISKTHQTYILWFRPEVLQTVRWGGNPNKPVEVQENGELRLSPRKSFALWQETVQGCALPWKPCEVEAAIELRSLIVGIVLRQADELAAMNIELQRSNEELDSFAYIASHDLKEPLRGIHNYANFLMEDYGETLNVDGIAKLQTLVRLTQRMEDLINSLLHFSRLGRAELSHQTIDLNELVQQTTATLTMSRPQTPVQFRIPHPLPPIQGDRVQINELFTNLISNAIKYNDKPEKWVEIGLLTTPPAPYPVETPLNSSPACLTFYVRDNGIGIAPEYQEKIFQIFRRLHGRDEYDGGTGAGLTIARKIVERHGGQIWVESAPGQGSTFYFTLAAEAIA